MTFDDNARSQEVLDEIDPGVHGTDGRESDRISVPSAPPAQTGPEQPSLRGEASVSDRTDMSSADASRPRAASGSDAAGPVFDQSAAQDFRSRWNDIQVAFVDEPRQAVGRADQLVAETIKKLSESFAAERQKLEGEWARGGNDSTETLRLALQHYRSYFNRLLSV